MSDRTEREVFDGFWPDDPTQGPTGKKVPMVDVTPMSDGPAVLRKQIHDRILLDVTGLVLLSDQMRQDEIGKLNGPVDELRRRTARLTVYLTGVLEGIR